MEGKTLAITAPLLLSAMFFHLRRAFGFLLLLSCLLRLTLSEDCSVNGNTEHDSCGSPAYIGDLCCCSLDCDVFGLTNGKEASLQNRDSHEAYVYPHSKTAFGPKGFHSSERCRQRSSVLLRNNMSGLGGKQLSKELYAKSIGYLPDEVQSIAVSGTRRGGDVFVVHHCKGFEFALAVPMKASIPVSMLDLCKKSFWVQLKRISTAALLAAAPFFLLLYLVFPQMTAIIAHDHLCENNKSGCNRVAVRRVEKSSSDLQEKHIFTTSHEMGSLLRCMRKEMLGRLNDGKDGVSENSKSSVEAQARKPPASVSSQEAAKPVNRTVMTVREKKKPRKKKRGAITLRLTEVSSNCSGNQTLTSPMSPVISATPEVNRPFRRVEPYVSRPAQAKKPSETVTFVVSHSVKFPCAAIRTIKVHGNSSRLAPHERAPGAKLGGEESGREEGKRGKRKEETYDIWGRDHLMDLLNLMDRFRDVREGKSSGFGEDESKSFFVNSYPTFACLFNQPV